MPPWVWELMLLMPALGRRAGTSGCPSVIPVSLLARVLSLLLFPFHCWWWKGRLWAQERERGDGLRVNVSNVGMLGCVPSARLWPTWLIYRGSLPSWSPVSLLVGVAWTVRTWQKLLNMTHIQGADTRDCHHPFHCWTMSTCTTVNHFSSRNPGIAKMVKRH